MKKRKIASLLILITINLIFSNSFGKKGNNPPNWVKQRPADSEYYIGIGIAKKVSGKDANSTAKSNALTDMASEISINLTSDVELKKTDVNDKIDEQYSSVIRTGVKNELEGYENVDSYETDQEVRVYYRLKKSTYQENRRRKIDNARSEAISYYNKAEIHLADKEINEAVSNYISALYAIRSYMNENIDAFTDAGKVILKTDAISKLKSIFESTKFENKTTDENVKVLTVFKEKTQSNLPIDVIVLRGGKIINEISKTSEEGFVQSLMNNNSQGIKKANLNINISSYFIKPIDADDKIKIDYINNLLKQNLSNYGNEFVFSSKKVIAYLEGNEMELGEKSKQNLIINKLKKSLQSNDFTFTNEKVNADIVLKIDISIDALDKIEKYNLYKVNLYGNIEVIRNKTEESIYNFPLSNIVGMGNGSNRNACVKAYEETSKLIDNKIVPEILSLEY